MGAIWDQQPGETVKAFNAFSLYLNMAPGERTYQKVADILGLKSQATVERWASPQVWDWQNRVLAYDRYMVSSQLMIRQDDPVAAMQATLEQEGAELAALTKLVEMSMKNSLREVAEGFSIDSLALQRLVGAMDKLHAMRRRNVGLPSTYRIEAVEDVPNEMPVFYAREEPLLDAGEE